MQDVFFGNVGQGGTMAVVVKDNVLELAAANGIILLESPGAIVRDNVVRTLPDRSCPLAARTA